MKKTSVFSLLIVLIVYLPSCNSPEKRALSNDSLKKTGSGMDPKRDTGFNKKSEEPKDQHITKNLSDEDFDKMINVSLGMKPLWENALGKDWEKIMTRKKLRDLYEKL